MARHVRKPFSSRLTCRSIHTYAFQVYTQPSPACLYSIPPNISSLLHLFSQFQPPYPHIHERPNASNRLLYPFHSNQPSSKPSSSNRPELHHVETRSNDHHGHIGRCCLLRRQGTSKAARARGSSGCRSQYTELRKWAEFCSSSHLSTICQGSARSYYGEYQLDYRATYYLIFVNSVMDIPRVRSCPC